MKISYSNPPVWDKIIEKFGIKDGDPIFATYGDCLYSPSGIEPTDDLLVHEMCHAEQQAHSEDTAKLWWQNYMYDPVWRVEQEAEAYGAQYAFLCAKYKDRNKRANILWDLAGILAGPIYGNATDRISAQKLIRAFAEHGRPPHLSTDEEVA